MKCDVFNIWIVYKDALERYISKRVPNSHDVDDILQTVLVKFASYCEIKNDVQNMKGWLYRIAHNTTVDYFKSSNRKKNISEEDIEIQETSEFEDDIFHWLNVFVDSLPAKYALPLKLSDLACKPQKVVADQLGLTLEATKSRIQRARKMLKGKFDECGIVEYSENQVLYTVTKPCCLL